MGSLGKESTCFGNNFYKSFLIGGSYTYTGNHGLKSINRRKNPANTVQKRNKKSGRSSNNIQTVLGYESDKNFLGAGVYLYNNSFIGVAYQNQKKKLNKKLTKTSPLIKEERQANLYLNAAKIIKVPILKSLAVGANFGLNQIILEDEYGKRQYDSVIGDVGVSKIFKKSIEVGLALRDIGTPMKAGKDHYHADTKIGGGARYYRPHRYGISEVAADATYCFLSKGKQYAGELKYNMPLTFFSPLKNLSVAPLLRYTYFQNESSNKHNVQGAVELNYGKTFQTEKYTRTRTVPDKIRLAYKKIYADRTYIPLRVTVTTITKKYDYTKKRVSSLFYAPLASQLKEKLPRKSDEVEFIIKGTKGKTYNYRAQLLQGLFQGYYTVAFGHKPGFTKEACLPADEYTVSWYYLKKGKRISKLYTADKSLKLGVRAEIKNRKIAYKFLESKGNIDRLKEIAVKQEPLLVESNAFYEEYYSYAQMIKNINGLKVYLDRLQKRKDKLIKEKEKLQKEINWFAKKYKTYNLLYRRLFNKRYKYKSLEKLADMQNNLNKYEDIVKKNKYHIVRKQYRVRKINKEIPAISTRISHLKLAINKLERKAARYKTFVSKCDAYFSSAKEVNLETKKYINNLLTAQGTSLEKLGMAIKENESNLSFDQAPIGTAWTFLTMDYQRDETKWKQGGKVDSKVYYIELPYAVYKKISRKKLAKLIWTKSNMSQYVSIDEKSIRKVKVITKTKQIICYRYTNQPDGKAGINLKIYGDNEKNWGIFVGGQIKY